MSKSIKIIYLLLFGFTSIGYAQNLDAYLKEAAENNPGLKAKYAEFEAAMQRVTQANALPDPTLSFAYFISPVETRVGPQQAKFGLSQMFPWFGTLSAKAEMVSLIAEAKYQEFLNTKNELYYKVKAAWYPLYELDKTIQLQQENLAILKTFKELSNSSFKNGKGSMADVIRVDIMIDDAEIQIQLLEDKKKPLLTLFGNLLNRESLTEFDFQDTIATDPINISIDYRRDSLLSSNPLFESYSLKLQSALAQEKVARKQALPQFGIGLDYVIVGERTDMNVADNGKDVIMPMVSISLPLYRGKYKSAIKEAQYIQTAITFSKEDFKNTLINSYDMTEYELNKAKQLISLYKNQIIKTKQVINLLLVAYSNSGKDFEEVLKMQQMLLSYKTAHITALKDYYTALAKLDYLTAKSE